MSAGSILTQLDAALQEGIADVTDPGASGTIEFDTPLGYAVCRVTTAGAESRTLQDADTFGTGQLLLVILEVDGGDLTISSDDTDVVLSAAGEFALFTVVTNTAAQAKVWRLVRGSHVNKVDLNGTADALILDADGDTTLSAPTDDQVDIEVGGADIGTLVAAGISLAAGSSYGGQGSNIGFLSPLAAQQDLSGAGAVNITTLYTAVTTTGANALTLADGAQVGQIKIVHMIVDAGDGTLTPANLAGGTTITFADVGDTAILGWDGTNWQPLALLNLADGATAPVLA